MMNSAKPVDIGTCLPKITVSEQLDVPQCPESSAAGRLYGPVHVYPMTIMASTQPLKKLRILIVEDDTASRELLRRFLDEYGPVSLAADGKQAIQLFETALRANRPYDLICLDIRMPEATGHQVLKSIREMEAGAGIEGIFRAKVIMTTASNMEEDVLGAYLQQCDAYLVKPVTKALLVERMQELKLLGNRL